MLMDLHNRRKSAKENQKTHKETEPDGMKLFYKGKELKMIHIDDFREVVELGRSLYPLDFALSLKNVWNLEKMSDDRGSLYQNYIYVGFVFGLAYAMGCGTR